MADLSTTEQKEQGPKPVIIPQETAVALANGLKHIFTPEDLANIVQDLKTHTPQTGIQETIVSMMEEKASGINQFITNMQQAKTVTVQPFQRGWETFFSEEKHSSISKPPPGEIVLNPVLASVVTRTLDHHMRNFMVPFGFAGNLPETPATQRLTGWFNSTMSAFSQSIQEGTQIKLTTNSEGVTTISPMRLNQNA